MGHSKTVDFYRCLRPVQDRFVAATRRMAPPAPLLFCSARRPTAWMLIAASVLLLVVATVVLVKGWGDVSSPLALHRRPMLFADALLFSAAVYCFVHAAVVLRALEALPYPAGIYVFPACVVDASGPVLRVWSVLDADKIERLSEPTALAFSMRDGERIVVPAPTAEAVERADSALTSSRPELTRALAEDDVDMLAELDPLHHTRVSSPISSTESMKPFSLIWVHFDWVLAVAIGVTLGLALGATRNASSDDRMYRTVVMAASVPLYEKYLERGGSHSDEVRDIFMARAELHEAQQLGTIDALREFVNAHPGAKIGAEVDAAMRRALLLELDKAKAIGTVTALDDFVRKYPDSHVDAELNAARHLLYSHALAAWKRASPADAPASAFIERLLASAEKLGAVCEVRFRFKPAKSLEDADRRLAKHAYFPGPEGLASHYFSVDAMRPREQRVAQSIVDGFAAVFPADVLAVRVGAPLAADAPTPTGAPVLVTDYAAEWSNSTTASAKPRTIFAGIRFDFDGHFILPEGAPLQMSLKSWRGPELWKIKGAMSLEEFHRKIYDAMIDRAFDEWRKKLADTFFR